MADFTVFIGRSGTIPFRPSATIPDGTLVFTAKKNTGAPITIQTHRVEMQSSGIGHVTLYDADTQNLTPGAWICDVQLIQDTGKNYLIAVGEFTAKTPVRKVGE